MGVQLREIAWYGSQPVSVHYLHWCVLNFSPQRCLSFNFPTFDLCELTVIRDELLGQLLADLKERIRPFLKLALDLLKNIVFKLYKTARYHVLKVGLFLFFNNGVDLFHRILLLLIFIEIKTAHFTIIICMAECRRHLSQKVLHGELEFLLVLLRLLLESLWADQFADGFLSSAHIRRYFMHKLALKLVIEGVSPAVRPNLWATLILVKS